MKTSVPIKRQIRSPASKAKAINFLYGQCCLGTSITHLVTSICCTLYDSLHTYRNMTRRHLTRILNIFCCIIRKGPDCFSDFLSSISPEAALQWSDSFEELLKHSGQMNALEFFRGKKKKKTKMQSQSAAKNSLTCCQTLWSTWIVSRKSNAGGNEELTERESFTIF